MDGPKVPNGHSAYAYQFPKYDMHSILLTLEYFRNKIEATLTQKLNVLKHNAVQTCPHLYNLPDLLDLPKFHTSNVTTHLCLSRQLCLLGPLE